MNWFEQLRGAQLSAVTFVQDYLQLWFDGPCINVMNPLTVESGGAKVTSWEPGFRDLLCAQIAKIVADVEHRTGDILSVSFEDGSRVSISLRPEDYTSPEAFSTAGFKNTTRIVG